MSKQASVSQAINYRNYRRARDRALRRLANDNPEIYAQYLKEEKASDEITGKKWLNTGATVGVSLSIQSYKDATEGRSYTSDTNQNESYYGGEE